MSLTCYNLSEDWGWYVDIEISNPVYQIRTDFVKKPSKKLNQHYNKLDTIEEEDEYEYHINNLKKLYDISSKNIDVDIEHNNNNKEYVKKMFSVGSTTMLTALLTYVVFYML